MGDWTSGNELRLLENGEELYPRIFEAVREARREVVLETFIWMEDKVGTELLQALAEAAGRGVQVWVLVDGYGSPGFSDGFLERIADAGIHVNARRRIVIANAYFFPGYRFIRDLRRAADRGVEIALIMQGKPDRPISVWAASILYNDLLSMGVRIFRYTERPLHAKVATIDDRWATVGSSNLDPLSLGLNFEANLFILDEQFNATLQGNLDRLIENSCSELKAHGRLRRSTLRRLVLTPAYHVMRKMPAWGNHLPHHRQRIRPLRPVEAPHAGD